MVILLLGLTELVPPKLQGLYLCKGGCADCWEVTFENATCCFYFAIPNQAFEVAEKSFIWRVARWRIKDFSFPRLASTVSFFILIQSADYLNLIIPLFPLDPPMPTNPVWSSQPLCLCGIPLWDQRDALALCCRGGPAQPGKDWGQASLSRSAKDEVRSACLPSSELLLAWAQGWGWGDRVFSCAQCPQLTAEAQKISNDFLFYFCFSTSLHQASCLSVWLVGSSWCQELGEAVLWCQADSGFVLFKCLGAAWFSSQGCDFLALHRDKSSRDRRSNRDWGSGWAEALPSPALQVPNFILVQVLLQCSSYSSTEKIKDACKTSLQRRIPHRHC